MQVGGQRGSTRCCPHRALASAVACAIAALVAHLSSRRSQIPTRQVTHKQPATKVFSIIWSDKLLLIPRFKSKTETSHFVVHAPVGSIQGMESFAPGRVGLTNVADSTSPQLDVGCLFHSYGEDMWIMNGPPTGAHVIELLQRLSSHMAMQGNQESVVVQTSLGHTTVPGSTRRLGTCEHLHMSGFHGRCWRMWYVPNVCVV